MMVLGEARDLVIRAVHDALELSVNFGLVPEKRLQVLHPLEVADGDATGAGQDVRDDARAALTEDGVGLGGNRTVGSLDDQLRLHAVRRSSP